MRNEAARVFAHSDLRPEAAPEPALDVSVVMPCLDEAGAVANCVARARRALAELGLAGEVIVVDNGSTDGSAAEAQAAGARVVHEAQRGYGSACRRGLEEAKGAIVVLGDADDSYDFGALGALIAPLRAREADLVLGSRLTGTILPGAMPWTHRWIGNPVLSGLTRLFFGARIADSQCGLRALTRAGLARLRLRATGMEFATEMLVEALREGMKVGEVPITYHPRTGQSKLSSLRDAWRHIRFMLLFSPSYLFRLPAILMMVAGAAVVAALVRGPQTVFGHRWDYHVLLFGALALSLGYNLLLFDVLAKVFSTTAGFTRHRRLGALERYFSLERGLLLGVLLFLGGLAVAGSIVWRWLAAGAGELMAVRGVAVGMTLMTLGAQTTFCSFLVSLMMIGRQPLPAERGGPGRRPS